MSARSLRTLVALALMLAVGATYLLVAVVRIDPFHRQLTMTVELTRTGGLMDTSPVTYRGVTVGHVQAIDLTAAGVVATVRVDHDTRIPVETDVAVAALSAAGEQYLDFRPRVDHGPYLADGARIAPADTRLPVPFTQALASIAALADQVEPAELTTVVDEMERAFGGSAPDVQRIIDGGEVLLGGLEEALPNTVAALSQGRVVLATGADLRDELARFAPDARSLTGQVRSADPTIRELVGQGPDTLRLLDQVVRDNGPDVAALLGDLGTSMDVVAVRSPAVSQFLPGLAAVAPAVGAVVKDKALTAIIDLAPRPTCDYGTQRRPPSIGGSPPPRLNRYCDTDEPRLQQRGAANAPRPPGDDTARPPQGADPDQRARTPRDTGPR